MKTKKLVLFALISTLTSAFSLSSWAYDSTEGEDWVSYDSIISELSTSKGNANEVLPSDDAFDQIKLHAGVGLATSYVFVSPKQSSRVYGFLRGFEANMGIDLFSRKWMAEGTFRSFGSEELRQGEEISLKEFDLKVVYQDKMSNKLGYKFASGLASRYLNYIANTPNGRIEEKYSTPSAILATGLRAYVSPMISVGADVGYRWAMVEDTIDESAIDAALRLDARF